MRFETASDSIAILNASEPQSWFETSKVQISVVYGLVLGYAIMLSIAHKFLCWQNPSFVKHGSYRCRSFGIPFFPVRPQNSGTSTLSFVWVSLCELLEWEDGASEHMHFSLCKEDMRVQKAVFSGAREPKADDYPDIIAGQRLVLIPLLG